MYYIYMIRCDDNSIYTGITKDIHMRMKEHYYKSEKCAKYTRTRNVVALESLWTAEDRSKASKLEYLIKRLSKQKKEEVILNPKIIDETLYTHIEKINLQDCLEQDTFNIDK